MDAFIGEIRAFPWNWAPQGWAMCNGMSMPIAQFNVLYAVIGINFGGDGRTSFNLPNLQTTALMGTGSGPGLTPRNIAATPVGANTVTLTSSQTSHSHALVGATPLPTPGTTTNESDTPSAARVPSILQAPGRTPIVANAYVNSTPTTSLAPQVVSPAGAPSVSPHENRQPYLAFNFCIATEGEFPTRP